MTNFSIAMTALRASSLAIDVTSNNIANANTDGYHRQDIRFRDRRAIRRDGDLVGTGVDLLEIRRLRNNFVEASITNNVSERAAIDDQLVVLRRIEALLSPGAGSVHDRLNNLLDQMERLATSPADATQRTLVIQAADSLATEIQRVSSEFARIESAGQADLAQSVVAVNRLTAEMSKLSNEIYRAEASGSQANDMRDEYDRLANDLAQYTDVDIEEQNEGQLVLIMGNGSVLVGQKPVELSVQIQSDGSYAVVRQGSDNPIQFGSGRLAGQLSTHNQITTQFTAQLNSLTIDLMTQLDAIHATGVGMNGAFERLLGQRGVADVSTPLASQQSPFPLTAGSLFVSVTDPSGARTLHEIAIDPATQSLNDLAVAISSVSNLNATVNTSDGTLAILAAPGYQFDFAGGLETNLDLSGVSGTAIPQITGSYRGDGNDAFTFTALGAGEVGVTPGLQVEVRDASGTLISTLDVGLGYEVNAELEIADGVSVQFAPGTLAGGDTFTTPLVTESDTSGVLVALGMNTFFTGSGAHDFRVSQSLLDDHQNLATIRDGEIGDGNNVSRFIQLRDLTLAGNGTRTFEEYLSDVTAQAGDEVLDATFFQDNLEFLRDQLQAERDSLSGVDTNEETVLLMQYQRAFEAAAKIVSTISEMLDDLFRLTG